MGTKKFNFNEVLKFTLALYSVISCSPNQQLYIHNSFSLRKQPFLLALRRWGQFRTSGEERGETVVFGGYNSSNSRKTEGSIGYNPELRFFTDHIPHTDLFTNGGHGGRKLVPSHESEALEDLIGG